MIVQSRLFNKPSPKELDSAKSSAKHCNYFSLIEQKAMVHYCILK